MQRQLCEILWRSMYACTTKEMHIDDWAGREAIKIKNVFVAALLVWKLVIR